MKRLLAFVMALCALFVLCACSGGEQSGSGSGSASGEPADLTPGSSATGEETVSSAQEGNDGEESPVQSGTDPWSGIGIIGGETLSFTDGGVTRIEHSGQSAKVTYITTPEQLPEEVTGYDSAFFQDHALVLVRVTTNSGSARLSVRSIAVDDGVATVYLEDSAKGEGTTDMAAWYVWAEVDAGLDYQWQLHGFESNLVKY